MATITDLPNDVIIIILGRTDVSFEDIVNFQSTCKRLQQITLSNKFWERKYFQRCPTAEKKYNKMKLKKLFHRINYKEKLKAGLHHIQKFQNYVSLMSENKLSDTDKKQFEHHLRLAVQISIKYYLVWDEMERISAQKLNELFPNLTREYYWKLTCHYLKQYRFIHKQIKLMSKPKTKFLLEQQLTIMAQYFQPRVSYLAVKTWLDEIVQTVLSRLREKYPAHSIFSTTLEQFSFWRDNNIADNFWNETESRQIMGVLEEFIFCDLEIYKLRLLKILHLEEKYIRYIAGCFQKYLLTVTYHIVARRLGIRTFMTMYRTVAISVIWKPEYNIRSLNNAEYFYVNHNSNLPYPSNIIRKSCQNNELSFSIDYMWLTQEMMMNIVKELLYNDNLHGWEFNNFYDFLHSCTFKNVESIDIEAKYKNITNSIEIKSNEKHEKKRTKNIKFAVGMIVRHIREDRCSRNKHDGVIIGWHHRCKKILKTVMFPFLHRISNYHHHICKCLFLCNGQTHYIILAENNRICFVTEDQLSICPPKEIDNIEIGKYFSSFEGTFYVPNENLKEQYPEDIAAITGFHIKQ